MPWDDHNGLELSSVEASVLIISDSLFSGQTDLEEDISGPTAIEVLSNFGFQSINLDYFPDDFTAIQGKIENDVSQKIGLLVLIGGTGVAPRDVTIEAVTDIIEKELPGFGELFRRKSYDTIGGKAILSRSVAGTVNETLIVALPGSPNAVTLGLEIIEDVIGHILKLLRG